MSMSVVLTTIVGAIMATIVMIIRLRATKKPATTKKIVLPPLFMSTGFLMFLYEPARPAGPQVFEALAVGMIFSIFLIKTSKFEMKDGKIYLRRSKAFVFILIGLLIVRVIFKVVIGDSIDVEELSGMFFILAYGMIIPWRISMFISYKKLEKQLKTGHRSIVPAQT